MLCEAKGISAAAVLGGERKSNKTTRDRKSETSKYYAKTHQKVVYQLFGDKGVGGEQTTTLLVGNNGYDARLGMQSDLK